MTHHSRKEGSVSFIFRGKGENKRDRGERMVFLMIAEKRGEGKRKELLWDIGTKRWEISKRAR
jgi:hypothetical protein